MKNESTKGLREGAMAVALTAVLMLITRYMPLFSMFGTFVCAIPMAVLAARNSFKVILPSVFVAFVVAILINGSVISAAALVLMSCVPGGVAGYMLGKKQPFFMTIISTSLAVCIGWIFELVMLEAVLGSGIDEMFDEIMTQTRTLMSGVMDSLGERLRGDAKLSPEQMMDTLISTTEMLVRLYFPSFVVISSLFTGYIIVRISGFILKRTKLAGAVVAPFCMLKAPNSMSIAAIIFYTVYIFMSSKSTLYPVFANIVFILYIILGICGLSVVDFKFKAKIKSSPVRFTIYILVMLFGGILVSVISTILIFIGILDAGRDFRKIGNGDM